MTERPIDRIELPEGVLEIFRGSVRTVIKFTANDTARVTDRCHYDPERGLAFIGLERNVQQGGEQ
jgi:hypothetical protein